MKSVDGRKFGRDRKLLNKYRNTDQTITDSLAAHADHF